jgi:hypothetical protein
MPCSLRTRTVADKFPAAESALEPIETHQVGWSRACPTQVPCSRFARLCLPAVVVDWRRATSATAPASARRGWSATTHPSPEINRPLECGVFSGAQPSPSVLSGFSTATRLSMAVSTVPPSRSHHAFKTRSLTCPMARTPANRSRFDLAGVQLLPQEGASSPRGGVTRRSPVECRAPPRFPDARVLRLRTRRGLFDVPPTSAASRGEAAESAADWPQRHLGRRCPRARSWLVPGSRCRAFVSLSPARQNEVQFGRPRLRGATHLESAPALGGR